MSTDSEEVEKVLQSLASEGGVQFSSSSSSYAEEDGDPDRDKVEELLRQLEQEKDQESTSEYEPNTNITTKSSEEKIAITSEDEIENEKENENGSNNNGLGEQDEGVISKPRPSGLKKPNGVLKAGGDKPAAPTRRKEPPGDDIPKPWKKKGAIRKKPEGDEDFFTIAAKEPPPTIHSDSDNPIQEPATPMETDSPSHPSVLLPSTSSPDSPSRIPVFSNAPKTPTSSVEPPTLILNGVHSDVNAIKSPPASPSVLTQPNTPPKLERTPPKLERTPSASAPSPYPTSPSPSSPAPASQAPASPVPTHAPTPSSPPPTTINPTPYTPPPSSTASTSLAPATPPLAHVTTHAPPTTPASSQPIPVPNPTTPPASEITSTTTSSPIPPRISTPVQTRSEPTQQKDANQARGEDVLIDDSIKDDAPVFSKQDFANLRSQILKQVSEETAILAQEFQELKLKYDEEIKGKLRLKSVLVEYEKTIAKLIDDAGMSGHHEALADRVIELENDTKRKTEEYEAIASAHSELKSRYENTKADNEKLKSNESVQKEALLRLQNELQASETRFNMLKSHAETKLDTASEQLVKLRDERAKEMAVLQTRTQKAEARTQSLEKENKELLSICDDLMSKLEQKNS